MHIVHHEQMNILTNRQPPSQPQLPGLILQLTFRTHYLTRESAQEITYIQSATMEWNPMALANCVIEFSD